MDEQLVVFSWAFIIKRFDAHRNILRVSLLLSLFVYSSFVFFSSSAHFFDIFFHQVGHHHAVREFPSRLSDSFDT
jgi:hypothetical protein